MKREGDSSLAEHLSWMRWTAKIHLLSSSFSSL